MTELATIYQKENLYFLFKAKNIKMEKFGAYFRSILNRECTMDELSVKEIVKVMAVLENDNGK